MDGSFTADPALPAWLRAHLSDREAGDMDITTIAPDEIVAHDGARVIHLTGLDPDTEYEVEGTAVRTMALPAGELLCRFATVNDVHFGETVAGIFDGDESGAIRPRPGEPPYPQTMNRAAVKEMAAIDPAAVLVKGDLTSDGTVEEYQEFLDVYQPPFGDRMLHIRGNHESYNESPFAQWPIVHRDVPGARLVMVDTSLDRLVYGGFSAEQAHAVAELTADSPVPVLLFGHHQVFVEGTDPDSDRFFAITPDDSLRLIDTIATNPKIRGYFAGHTHRNRVVHFDATDDVPFVEVASVKDFPGSWAEYRVYETAVLQIHRRISTPEALDWTERTRAMFAGYYPTYSFGELSDRCFSISV